MNQTEQKSAQACESNGCVVLCPGQGAQHVGMAGAWVEQDPVARDTFAAAGEVVGYDLLKACVHGPQDRLNRTDVAQVAIYVASVACYRALRGSGRVGPLAAVAGLSLGEFTALHLAGAWDFATGLRLVELRGLAMHEAALASRGGMVALIGADEQQAGVLCEQVCDELAGTVLVPANMNCPGQVVISGAMEACQRALGVAEGMNLRATLLSVEGAFHSPLMGPAAERLAEALEQAAWREPVVPVMSNVTGLPHPSCDIDAIKRSLVGQLTRPVRWADAMVWLTGHVRGRYVELAPGKVLSGLMRRIDRGVKVENYAEPCGCATRVGCS